MDPRSIQCLQHSIVTAKNLQRLLASRLHGRLSSLPSCQLPPIPTLELPFPEDIWLSIQKLDLPEQAIERVYQKFVETINNTRQIHIQQYEQGCHRLLESLTSKEQPIKSTLERLCHSFRHSYESKYLPLIRSEILGLTKTNNASRKREKKGTPFNSVSGRRIRDNNEFWTYLPFRSTHLCWKSTSSTMRIPLHPTGSF